MEHEERLKAALADRYAVDREIGCGGMATVYLATDLKHNRQVAVKVLDPDLAQSLGAERFLREIETVANLTHPHILPVFDSGEADGFLFFVMPYVKGDTLRSRLAGEKQLPVEDAVRITREVASALDYAHREGVIHRDVKPANILFQEGEPLVADFGIAQAVSEAKDSRLTQAGTSLGTPAYMSPEQAAGEESLDGRSDQYALGCVLYEMLAGHPPFAGDQAEVLVRRHLLEAPPSVAVARPAVSDEVVTVLDRALAKSPADRFRTTGELADAFASSSAPRKTRRASGRVKALAYSAAVILGLATVAVLASRQSPNPPAFPEERVVVIPFANETGDPTNEATGKMLAHRIFQHLEVSGIALPAPQTNVSFSWESHNANREREPGLDPITAVASEFGAGTVVLGTLFRVGDSLRFEAEITRPGVPGSGTAVEPVVIHASDQGAGIEMIAGRVAAMVAYGLDPTWGESFPPLDMPSLATYRDYTAGLDAFFRDLRESARLFEQGLQRDPSFITGQVQLAVVYLNLGEFERADSLLGAAAGFIDRMGRLPRTQWRWARAVLDGDREGAYRVMKEASEHSTDVATWWSLGFESLRMNRPQEAFDALDRIDRNAPVLAAIRSYWVHLGQALHVLGDHRRELTEVQEGRARHPEYEALLGAEIRAYAALGELMEVESLLDETVNRSGNPVPFFLLAARELRAHENLDASFRVGERALVYLQGQGDLLQDWSALQSSFVEVLYGLERWGEALPIAKELARDDPSNHRSLGYLGRLAARMGDRDEAVRVSEQLANFDRPFMRGTNTQDRARIAALLGERDPAVSLLRLAHEQGFQLGVSIHADMDLEPLRGYPPFEEFMRPKG